MFISSHRWITLIGLFGLVFGGSAAFAQNRSDCLSEPDGPGACFQEIPEQEIFIGCNFYGESDVVEGIIVWTNLGIGHNDFSRTNPDGSQFVHVSDRDVTTVYCPWDTVLAGFCAPDSVAPDLLYYGNTELQNNGYFAAPNQPGCPFLLTSRGEVERPADGDVLKIQMKLQFVRDALSPTGCRRTCTILKENR